MNFSVLSSLQLRAVIHIYLSINNCVTLAITRPGVQQCKAQGLVLSSSGSDSGSQALRHPGTQAHSGSDSGSVSQNNEHVPRNEISRKRIHSDSEETDGPLRKKIKDSRDENAEFIAQAIECNYEGVDDLRRELEQGLKTIKQKA